MGSSKSKRKHNGTFTDARRVYSLFFLEQSLQVAEKHFSTEMELVLLVINPSLVEAEIKYELASNGQNYPHIYGTVNANAVVKVVELQKENGGYVLPVELEQK